jgi:thioredoxin-like negative regulator of GroEL
MYSDFIKSKSVVVIHFWAAWNLYDEEMRSRLKQIAVPFTDQIAIGSIDTGQQEMWELIRELKVKNLPALASYKNGQHIETTIGLCPKEQIEVKLKVLWATA